MKDELLDSSAVETAAAMVELGHAVASASGSGAAERAVRSLSLCSGVLGGSLRPQSAWRFSGLCSDGCPLEFTLSSADNALRFTVDVAPPEIPHQERLSAACELGIRMGHPRVDPKTLRRWSLMQEGQTLTWGARLGIRESDGLEMLKIYLEVPVAARSSVFPDMSRPFPDSVLVMIGHEPGSGRTEYYFARRQFSLPDLNRLLGMLSSNEERAVLVGAVEHVCGMPLASALFWAYFGFSLAFSRGISAPLPALFLKNSAIGGAARTRQRMLQCMPARVKERSLYSRLLAGMPEDELPDHGVVSICGGPGGPGEMRVGLSGMALAPILRGLQPKRDGCVRQNGVAL